MTFDQFCKDWKVQSGERGLLVEYLAFMRMRDTLRLARKGGV